MSILTRAEAKRRGLTRFRTGKPCKHGHYADRYVANGCCAKCISMHVRRTHIRKKADAYFQRARQYIETIAEPGVRFLPDDFQEEMDALVARMRFIAELRTSKQFQETPALSHIKLEPKKPDDPKPKLSAVRTTFRRP